MSLFDLVIVQPIFNILVLIYGLLPGGNFAVAVILFTVLTRLLMWPLVKKQLHQAKVIRTIQPELKKIKQKTKGNKQLETQLMLELYRERGVSPFSSLGLLLVQLPVLVALYQVINIFTSQRERIAEFTYGPLESFSTVKDLIANPNNFNESLFGILDLTERAVTPGGIGLAALALAIAAAGLQYLQAKQTLPQAEESKRLRDVLKQQSAGQDVDQAEISAIVTRKMVAFLPLITLVVGLYLPSALVLYITVSSLVAVIQQHIILNQDAGEMQQAATQESATQAGRMAKATSSRAAAAQPAEIITSSGDDGLTSESKPVTVKQKQSRKKRKRR